MKFTPALLLSLVLVTAPDARAASPDATVAAALKKLETARENLTKAVQRIEADPPSTPDLDAAFAAVGALKDAVEAGAEFESKDLDYAKSSLAARKELRTQREYVDQRRAKVHIFNQRRVIDEALVMMKDRARAIDAKEPGEKDFDDARAATAAVKKAVDEARQFTSQDQKFAAFITDTDAAIARQSKAINERWALLSGDKHRAVVEDSRQALATAMTPLGPSATDAQFEAADKAATLLAKHLDEGKVLESDKAYRAAADKARSELAQSKKKRDELWSATGLARLKAEIEPADKDLAAASKTLKARKPTADQLAEAKAVAFVVQKLIEKFKPEAERSAAFGQYVNEVKGRLVEVEVQLELRSLDAAKGDLNRAMRLVEGRAPTDEHFAEATSAATILEKTLETVHRKDPAMSLPYADAKTMLKDSRAMWAKRRVEVDVDRQRAKVEEARKAAATLIGQLNQPNVSNEKLVEAETAVKQIGTVLEQGAELKKKNREYVAYDKEVKQRMNELNGKIAARRVALSAAVGRGLLTEAMASVKEKLEAAKQPSATDADVEAAAKAVDSAATYIDSHNDLEQQDRGYSAQADRAREQFGRIQEALELAKAARELRKRTGDALAAGAAAADAAAAAGDLRAQKAQYDKALPLFKACKEDGASQLRTNPALEKVLVLVDGRPTKPNEVITLCGQRADTTAAAIKPLAAMIAFDEGPKRAYEKAKGLLSQGKKADALAQFDECIATGLTVQHRNPELKDRSFEVAGGNMTLSELIKQCSANSKTLLGK